MFVVGTVQRVANKKDASQFSLMWPIVFEDETQGFIGGVVAQRDNRDTAQKLADALNAVIASNP